MVASAVPSTRLATSCCTPPVWFVPWSSCPSRRRVARDARHRPPADRADSGGEGVADQRLVLLVHRSGGAPGDSQDHGLRRATRPPSPARRRRPPRPGRLAPSDLLPHRLGGGVDLEPGPVAADWSGAGSGGPGLQPLGDSGTRRQHEALAAVWAQLRVLLRGPIPGRRAGCRHRQRHPVPRGRHVGQALRGQQPGDRPAPGGRPGRRAHPPRDLPARIRTGRQRPSSRGR